MKKKITAIFLCIALAATAIVGASLAYFTDDDSATNTFTVGNVQIAIVESKLHREGNGNSSDKTIAKPTTKGTNLAGKRFTYVKGNSFNDQQILDDSGTNNGNYKSYLANFGANMVPGRNVAKCVYVQNTGANNAYIRIRVMIPAAADRDHVATNAGGVITNQWCTSSMDSGEFAYTGNYEPVYTNEAYTDKAGIKYNVYTFVRNQPLAAGALTEWNVWNYIGIAKEATNDDIQKAIDNGAITKQEDGSLKLNILVQADAIQSEGFDNATDAFKTFDDQTGDKTAIAKRPAAETTVVTPEETD